MIKQIIIAFILCQINGTCTVTPQDIQRVLTQSGFPTVDKVALMNVIHALSNEPIEVLLKRGNALFQSIHEPSPVYIPFHDPYECNCCDELVQLYIDQLFL